MAYLGRKAALAPLTSADIPAGIVEGTDIAFFENASSTQNLGGTYSTERMYLNDSYTLTGDVNITGHLALGTVGNADVVITNDSSARTITGSGTLESGELLSSKETDLTGMTGELGSVVNLDSATFPAGHVLQVVNTTRTDTFSESLGSGVISSTNAIDVTIRPSSTNNKIFVLWSVVASGYAGSAGNIALRVVRGNTNVAVGDVSSNRNRITSVTSNRSNSDQATSNSGNLLDSPNTTDAVVYGIRLDNYDNGTNVMYLNRSVNDTDNAVLMHRSVSSITVMEIVG